MQGPGYLVCGLSVLDPRDFQLCQSDFRGTSVVQTREPVTAMKDPKLLVIPYVVSVR